MTAKLHDVEETVEAIRKVGRDIKNYNWMANLISKNEVDNFIPSGTTQYGIEATLPKAPYQTSDPTYGAVKKKLRSEERNKRYIKQVRNLEMAVETLEDEKERIVIEGCMDKISLREVGQVMGISKQATFEIKERAIRKLAVKMYL
ncbi:hypothetical protein [Halobacillus massiliensis]|uniref:hypothetical protein n=1 Tax=Halobacillus massiliensis TaxID=1926286 RepID=UPI0009E31A94|nr:hypothetical protein [Halobacillus massiliensis]